MKYEVSCWNKNNGCETITDVSNIAEHFHRDCAYHSTCCPKCSSTVLRKNIVAHLESHCATHVLNRKCTGSAIQGVSTEMAEFRKCLRGIELSLRSSTHTNTSVWSTLQVTEANHQDDINQLLTMAAEVKQVSLSTMQALTLAKSGCQRSLNHAAHLRTFEARLSTELEKLERVAAEWGPCEAATSREKAKLEERFENLEQLRKEIEVVSSKLQELSKRVDTEVARAERAVVGGLLEVRVSNATSLGEFKFSDAVTARVFEDSLRVPVIALFSVHRQPTPTHTDEESRRWDHEVESSVDDDRYRIRVLIHRHNEKKLFHIEVCVIEYMRAVLAKHPQKVKVTFIDGRKGPVECESDEIRRLRNMTDVMRRRFLMCQFEIDDPEMYLRIHRDQLRMRLTFFY